MALTAKQQRFVEEYLVDLNATAAAIRAGYSEKTARSIGHELLSKPEIQAAIEAALAERSKRTEITADDVLQRLWSIASADPNELVQLRRTCCRHCWGEGFRRQNTEGEMRERRALHDAKSNLGSDESEAWDADGLFDEQGGIGFNATRPPNPACPECFGEGVADVHLADTRNVSPAARALYAGAKVTDKGLELKLLDQLGALRSVGEHLGMFKQRHEHTGKDGEAIDFRGMGETDLAAKLAAIMDAARARKAASADAGEAPKSDGEG
jgi:hypothetical protein